jgi:hypothetical protein
MGECDVDGILEQIQKLDAMKKLRANMDDFTGQFPGLAEIGSKLDNEIINQEAAITEKMSSCGQNIDMLEPTEVDSGIESGVESL